MATAPAAFDLESRNPQLAEWLKGYPDSVFSDSLYQSIELMERYSVTSAIEILNLLGVFPRLTEWRSPDELCRALLFQPRFAFALQWLLSRVFETGSIDSRMEDRGRSYRLRPAHIHPRSSRDSDRESLRALALKIDNANAATLDLLDHAASVYPSVARGEQGGDQALFDPRGVTLWLNYFNNANPTYAVNNSLSAIVAADRVSARTKLRILELGAGAGSATEKLLDRLNECDPLSRIDKYVVTEPNAFFRRRAQRELASRYPNLPLEWSALDLNQPWESQLGNDKFDLVYAVNVLHVAKDLLFSLNEARSVLAPEGWLIIGECVRPFPNQPMYPELMFEILESFTDIKPDSEFRPNPGFLTAEQWRTAFTRAGFDRVEVAPEIDRIREIYSHFFTGAICGQHTRAG
jgi:SAM-dependent methyltransferase